MELDEDQKRRLDEMLQVLMQEQGGEAEFTVFRPDQRKSGGAYVKVNGVVKSVDAYAKVIKLESGECLNITDVVDISIRGGN